VATKSCSGSASASAGSTVQPTTTKGPQYATHDLLPVICSTSPSQEGKNFWILRPIILLYNSGYIKDRVVKSAYIRGFSVIADRMLWPPSLSRDRKWPCPTTLWMRVTPVVYKLAGTSVMGQKMCFSIVCINFAVRVVNLIFSTILRKYTRNSLSTQCKKFSWQYIQFYRR